MKPSDQGLSSAVNAEGESKRNERDYRSHDQRLPERARHFPEVEPAPG
jgi:hypothetical protein